MLLLDLLITLETSNLLERDWCAKDSNLILFGLSMLASDSSDGKFGVPRPHQIGIIPTSQMLTNQRLAAYRPNFSIQESNVVNEHDSLRNKRTLEGRRRSKYPHQSLTGYHSVHLHISSNPSHFIVISAFALGPENTI